MRYVLTAALALAACERPAQYALTAPPPAATADAGGGGDLAHAGRPLDGGEPDLASPSADMALAVDLAPPAGDLAEAAACGQLGDACCYQGGLGYCVAAGGECMGELGAPDTTNGGFLCGGPPTNRCIRPAASACGEYPYRGCTIDGQPGGAYCVVGASAPASGPEAPIGGICQNCN